MTRIDSASARSIYDSRGRPTIEVELRAGDAMGRGVAPAGASRGAFEAHERRDADRLGVEDACTLFRLEIAPALLGNDCSDQEQIDRLLIELDASEQRRRLGGNTLIATSMAALQTAAAAQREPLWRYLAQTNDLAMPRPQVQIIGGGAHAHGRIDIQDIMALPLGAADWQTALDWCARVYRAAGEILADANQLRGVADEGGFWPDVDGNEAALDVMLRAIERAGLRPFDDVAISLDLAASQFYRNSAYRLDADAHEYAPDEWVEQLAQWCHRYPVRLVEDPCAEDDQEHYAALRATIGPRVAIVGDDLVVTNADRIRNAADQGLIDAALIKPNQAGTISEAHAALDACNAANVLPIVSARSGETEDTSIVHLAVGWRAPMLKIGSITRGERTAKWNEGTRIAERLRSDGALLPFPPTAQVTGRSELL